MASKSTIPIKPLRTPSRPAAHQPYLPGDALPLPDVVEKDSDSVWALWSQAVGEVPNKDSDAQPPTELMGLPELPKDSTD